MCGLGMICGMGVGCKRICYGAGVMWCSAGEEKREREKGIEVKEERRERLIYYIKKIGKRVAIYMNL